MNRKSLVILGAAFVLLFAACPGKDESPVVLQTAVNYWNFLYKGETRAAFDMLDKGSKQIMNYSRYSRKVGFGPGSFDETREYWKAYYPLTNIEVNTVSVRKEVATVSLTLTIPDPTWFPDEAYQEAEKLGLKDQEYALFMIRAQTEALKQGRIPTVRISEVTNLLKEDGSWKIVFKDEG